MKKLPVLPLLGCAFFGVFVLGACAKNGSDPSSNAAPIAACSDQMKTEHDIVAKTCASATSKSDLDACNKQTQLFTTKYGSTTCSATDASTGQSKTLSASDLKSSAEAAQNRIAPNAPASTPAPSAPVTHAPSAPAPQPVVTGPDSSGGDCSPAFTADYRHMLDVSCGNTKDIPALKACQTGYASFMKSHTGVNCQYSENRGGRMTTTLVNVRSEEDQILVLQSFIDAKSEGDASIHSDCSNAVAKDATNMLAPCFQSATEDASDIKRLKACVAGQQSFVSKHPSETCKMPDASTTILVVSSTTLKNSIKNLQALLAIIQ